MIRLEGGSLTEEMTSYGSKPNTIRITTQSRVVATSSNETELGTYGLQLQCSNSSSRNHNVAVGQAEIIGVY